MKYETYRFIRGHCQCYVYCKKKKSLLITPCLENVLMNENIKSNNSLKPNYFKTWYKWKTVLSISFDKLTQNKVGQAYCIIH